MMGSWLYNNALLSRGYMWVLVLMVWLMALLVCATSLVGKIGISEGHIGKAEKMVIFCYSSAIFVLQSDKVLTFGCQFDNNGMDLTWHQAWSNWDKAFESIVGSLLRLGNLNVAYMNNSLPLRAGGCWGLGVEMPGSATFMSKVTYEH